MVAARDVPDPIQWHEGMLLSPHHFQQESLRNQMMVAAHVGLASPFHWGVVHLLLDRVALVSGVVRILELEAVMPDGLVLSHDAGAPQPLEIDISAMADPLAQAPFTIHLTVPAARAGSWGGGMRWQSVEGRPVADENGGDELAIPRLRPRLGLAVTAVPGEKPPQRLVSIPLAQVSFANESFALADFAPPALAVTANSVLGRLTADVARRLREKAMLLAERGGGGKAADMVSDNGQALRHLVAALPVIEAQLAVEVCHPFTLFQSLCGLAGHVSAFAGGALPPKLSRYDHDDPLKSFAEVIDYLQRMIGRVADVAQPVHFTFEDGMFGLTLREAWLNQGLVVGIRGPQGMSAAEIVAWMDNAVIGSRPTLERLAMLRVKGAERGVAESAPDLGLSPQRGTVLFRIHPDPALIVAGERLEIWNPDNLGSRFRPTDVVLFVLAP